ncbi:hypothetical protein [Tenacibaculum sp. 1_MG-2023]|uniref:hypothetical protein n=1 Tax=Tenacibaculum sp. 1_MG-2023 TaxID=3062653 RepID=UPI0026E36BED|nr:hypothetical protein [Tenacibaculum sp. 1_MG-2023]MDO6598926.1 hypothetical protein [Tenacibaculum sp. 1_MG-2023]
MKKGLILLSILVLFQSCYFGIGLVEDDLPGNFMLFANNEYEELAIINSSKDKSTYNIVVDETVFSVGYNEEFIIAKSYSNNKILYHIIEIKNDLKQKYLNLSFHDYQSKRVELNLPIDLNFTIVYQEVLKN